MKKDLLVLGFVVLILVIAARGTKIQTVEEYYATHIDDITEDSKTVWLTIRCDTVLDNWEDLDFALKDGKYIPEDGVILSRTRYVLRPGDSVFEILNRAVRHNKIHMEYQGADMNVYNSIYIQGINHLYEFSCGPLSGWVYKVNGESTDVGCSRCFPEDGDEIEWLYTCDLGRDVGAYVLDSDPEETEKEEEH